MNDSELLAQLTNQELKFERQQTKTNTLFKVVIVCFCIIVLGMSIWMICQHGSHKRDMARQLDYLTKVNDGFAIVEGMSEEEKYFKFKKFMMRIIGAFGYEYNIYWRT